MTNQKIFDQVVKHALSQMERSEDTGLCLYQGPRGLKCFIGVLIPDALYDPEMESMRVCGLCANFPKLRVLLSDKAKPPNFDLMEALQEVHDHSDPKDWVKKLMGVAEKYKLSTKVLEEAELR